MKHGFDSLFGEPPFGFRRAEDGELVPDEAEQMVLRTVAACRKAGLSWTQIAVVIRNAFDVEIEGEE